MIWDAGGSILETDEDQISEGNVCHVKKFGFHAGDVWDPLKETIWKVNGVLKRETHEEAIARL